MDHPNYPILLSAYQRLHPRRILILWSSTSEEKKKRRAKGLGSDAGRGGLHTRPEKNLQAWRPGSARLAQSCGSTWDDGREKIASVPVRGASGWGGQWAVRCALAQLNKRNNKQTGEQTASQEAGLDPTATCGRSNIITRRILESMIHRVSHSTASRRAWPEAWPGAWGANTCFVPPIHSPTRPGPCIPHS